MRRLDHTLLRWHQHLSHYRTLQYFTAMTRLLLAIALLPSGLSKVLGHPFTVLTSDTPIGLFFEGFFQAKAYYAFVGWAQLSAALLLLIPQTAMLGAVVYFPIVLNIWLITLSSQFKGTIIITSLMLLASIYLYQSDV